MEIEELIERLKKNSVKPEAIKTFDERRKARSKKFEDEYRPITNELLNRDYTI